MQLLDAESRFRLAADPLQWIVQQRTGVRRTGPRKGESVYIGRKFCTTRDVLLRDLRELGCELTLKARARVEAFPDTIKQWLERFIAEPVEVLHAPIPGVSEGTVAETGERERTGSQRAA